jgi:hypothetical protein
MKRNLWGNPTGFFYIAASVYQPGKGKKPVFICLNHTTINV